MTNGSMSFWRRKRTLFGRVPGVGTQNGSVAKADGLSELWVGGGGGCLNWSADFQSLSARTEAKQVPILPANFEWKPSQLFETVGNRCNLQILVSVLVVTVRGSILGLWKHSLLT